MGVDFNKIIKAKERDIREEYKDREKRCKPVSQKIIEMMAAEKLPMGEISDKDGKIKKEVQDKYNDFSIKVLTFMLQSNIKYSEKKFIFQLMKQVFEQFEERVISSLEKSFERAFVEKWKDELDITLVDIHQILLDIANKK